MAEDPPGPIEQITAEFLPEDWLLQEDICKRVGISYEVFALCLQWEIIRPDQERPQEPLRFPQHEVHRLCRGLRLHRDLGINWPGVVLALDLLERIENIERQLEQN